MKHIKRYCEMILNEEVRSCPEQKRLCQMVLRCFETEDIYVDEAKVDGYFGLEKYFPYELMEWERFCFVLHCCVYRRADNSPRWPDLFMLVGRGSGKNGYTSFEDTSLLSPVNGIRRYNIQAFAAAEENAQTSSREIREEVLENPAHTKKLSKFFQWSKEYITCTKTNSTLTFHTSRPQSKDGGRPGKVNFDEVHVLENYDLIDVAVGGLGKVADPRQLITTTDGYVRDGPLDDMKEKSIAILNGEREDNGFLPFICRLRQDEIADPENWIMAVPSLNNFPVLRREMEKQYADYKADPITHRAFAVKRCNCPDGAQEGGLTSWENIQACCRGPMPETLEKLKKKPCVICFDYAQVSDFLSAGVITLSESVYYFEQHTWVCRQSRDLYRINFPLEEESLRGTLTWVDAPEVPAELPVLWIKERTEGKRILAGAADSYRFPYLRRASTEILGIDGEARKSSNNYGKAPGKIYFTRPSDLMKASTLISSVFANHKLYCGDSRIMRWYFGNVKKVIDKDGNTKYEKIDPKKRKTDGAMCLFAGLSVAEILEPYDNSGGGFFRIGTRVY